MTNWKAPTDFYRLYGADWELLYVGISQDAFHRFTQHSRRSFWKLVTYATVVHYRTRTIAAIVEAHAIRDESPLFNIASGERWARQHPLGDGPELWTEELDYDEFWIREAA